MKDKFNEIMKRREAKILGMLVRFTKIPVRLLCEVAHPALDEAGFDFSCASVCDPAPGALSSLFTSPTIPVTRKPFGDVVRGEGDWFLVLDPNFGAGTLDSLWLLSFVDAPDDVLRHLLKGGPTEGQVVVKHLKNGHLVAVQGTVLRSLVKNHGRD